MSTMNNVHIYTKNCPNTVFVREDSGLVKKFKYNPETHAFDDITLNTRQFDNHLIPRHSNHCTHLKSTILFCYNTVTQKHSKYIFNSEFENFEEVKCDCCHLKPQSRMETTELIMVTMGADNSRVMVICVGEDGRVLKQLFDEKEKKFEPMKSTEIKVLGNRTPYTVTSILDNQIRPYYAEASQILHETRVVVGENIVTGELGKYIFDQCSHCMLQVEVEDVEYNMDMIMKDRENGKSKILYLAMSTQTEKAVAILRSEDCRLEKRYLNTEAPKYIVMEPAKVVSTTKEVQEFLDKAKKNVMKGWGGRQEKPFYQMAVKHMAIDAYGDFRGQIVNLGIEKMASLSLKEDDAEAEKKSEEPPKEAPIHESSDDEDSFDLVSDAENL